MIAPNFPPLTGVVVEVSFPCMTAVALTEEDPNKAGLAEEAVGGVFPRKLASEEIAAVFEAENAPVEEGVPYTATVDPVNEEDRPELLATVAGLP